MASSFLEKTTAQKVRSFLEMLGVEPPATASANEVLALLVSRVRARRDDRDMRARLHGLLADLAQIDAARLPAPQCETADATALAEELAALLSDAPRISPTTPPRAAMVVLAAALLTAGLALTTGCQKRYAESHAQTASDVAKCSTDVTSEHFRALVHTPEPSLSSGSEFRAVRKFIAETPAEQAKTMRSLCGMSAADIRTYIHTEFGGEFQYSPEIPRGFEELKELRSYQSFHRPEREEMRKKCNADTLPDHFFRLMQQRTPFDDRTIDLLVRKFEQSDDNRWIMAALCGRGAWGVKRVIKYLFRDILTPEQVKLLDQPYDEKPGDYVVDAGVAYKGVEF
jgi:hypothetical protein